MSTLNLLRDVPNQSNIARMELPNGMTILVYENFDTQSVVLSGTLLAGAIYEEPEKNGLASLTASALMRGTLRRDFDALHHLLEESGADIGISAGTNKLGFHGKALAEDLPLLLDVLSDVLRYPAFPINHVERLRGEILTWLKYQQQDTRRQVGKAFREQLYASDHPYYYSTRGTLDTLPTITIEDLRQFHAMFYRPHGMIITVVGAVKAQDAIQAVERYFGDWQNPDYAVLKTTPPANTPKEIKRVFVPVSGKSQTEIMLGVIGPSRFAPDYYAANMANSILGQFGMMGRIGEVVREQSGMAYYASSRLEGGYGPGAWTIAAGVNPTNVEKAIPLILSEIQRLITDVVTDEELDDNKQYFTGRLPLQLETNEGITGVILSMESYGLGLDYLLRYREIIFALTQEDLLAAAQHYWQPSHYILAIAGPEIQ